MVKPSLMDKLKEKHDEIFDSLKKSGHDIATFQYHLDKGSMENVYWHHGYMEALADMIRLLERDAKMNATPAEPPKPVIAPQPAEPALRRSTRARTFTTSEADKAPGSI